MMMTRAQSRRRPTIESEEPRALADGPSVDDVVLWHYDREHLPLRRYLKLTGVDESVAQEIVQETFLRLHRHLCADGDRTNLRAWCYRVAQNLARNERAAARQKRWAPLEEHLLQDAMPSVESQLLIREHEEKVRKALGELSDAERECLILRSQGLKYREVAAVLDISVSTAAENVQRGLRRLKEFV
jgi:RNA polymerase sigma-70 factor (ECF subfamily)